MGTIKAAKTVMEMAEVALTAVECCHKRHLLHETQEEQQLESLKSENRRLKKLLQENLKLLHNIAQDSASLLPDCPPDVYNSPFLLVVYMFMYLCLLLWPKVSIFIPY